MEVEPLRGSAYDEITTEITSLPNEMIVYMYWIFKTSSAVSFAATCKRLRECMPKKLAISIAFKAHRKEFAYVLNSINRNYVVSNFIDIEGIYVGSYFLEDRGTIVDYRLHPNGMLTVYSKEISKVPFGENWDHADVDLMTKTSNGHIYPVSTEMTVSYIKLRGPSDKYYTTIVSKNIVPETTD